MNTWRRDRQGARKRLCSRLTFKERDKRIARIQRRMIEKVRGTR